ncbi:MAG: LysR family transcriptional regulator [Burkholderiales bacterium]|uniref:LysR substrate-binding domain-containing protein n=1 Tax=Comamonas granuli TaxID=290309 RepID=UPI0005AAF2F6|nr:LysR substrate-binding domain-containing protein [Comamonas granuli]MCZ2405167.1 LysR family transcriptional regulator [Burkholderiales bacterium]
MRKDIPSLGVLQAFEASARLLSFSRAAEELALTPSAVSRHVAALEDRLGVTLFVRARRRLMLTDTGRSYAARIRLHLEQIERDTQEIRVGREEGYVLNLAVVSTFCTQWLIPRLPQFAAQHPRITLNLSVRSEAFAFDESGFDAALYYGDRLWPDTQGSMVVPEGSCAPVCSPAYAQAHSLQDESAWLQCPHLTLASRPNAWRDWYAARGWHYTLHASRGPRYELFSMVIAAAAVGLGVGLVPLLLAQEALDSGRLVLAHPQQLAGAQGYWCVQPQHRPGTEALQAFREWLQAQGAS